LLVFLEADDEARTRDLRLGKPTLYQLSYIRVSGRFYGPVADDVAPSRPESSGGRPGAEVSESGKGVSPMSGRGRP
jgi:hypothetical protein